MSFQTAGRWPDRKHEEPVKSRSGQPGNYQYYSGQLIAQDASLSGTAAGSFRPYITGVLTASVIVGVNAEPDQLVTSTNPLPNVLLEVHQGVFAFANDPASSGSFSAATLENTLAWGVDDQTVSTLSGSGRMPVGRFRVYDPLNANYPVFVEVGTTPSGTVA